MKSANTKKGEAKNSERANEYFYLNRPQNFEKDYYQILGVPYF